MQIIVRVKVLSKSLTSEQMATMIGLVPERSWNIGDFRPKTKFRETTNGIIIGTGIDWCRPIEKHLEAIMDKITPVRERFLALTNECTIQLSIVYYSDHTPGLWLNSGFVAFLADINAEIDIDGYVLDSDIEQ
jgi:hypothetical protein